MLQVQRGDSQAFEVLFGRYERRIYGFLVRRTGDREAAAELFQDTFLKMFRARDSWDTSRPVKPWLFGIAANAAIDQRRRQLRRPVAVSLEEWDAPTRAHSASADARLTLERGLTAMPETLRAAFVLGAVQGLNHHEVSEALSISPANARARISRGRSWLRRFISEDAA